MEQKVTVIPPVAEVRDVGVLLNQELSMTQHNAGATSSCCNQLRQLLQIRRLVGHAEARRSAGSFVRSIEARAYGI